MTRIRDPLQRLLCLLLALAALPAAAAVRVEIEGLRGATLREQARSATSLQAWRDRAISDAQVQRLHEQAPAEIRRALEPYGYYRAEVTPSLTRDGEDWVARYAIRVRTSVKVREIDLRFAGAGADDATLAALQAQFPLQPGDRLVHGTYERGRTAMAAAIQGRGYLRARAELARVEVHVADNAADIRLHWQTGPRYRFGPTEFIGAQFPDDFMRRYVQHREGDLYDAEELLKLQRRLIDADYFGMVSVSPRLQRRGRRGDGADGSGNEGRPGTGDAPDPAAVAAGEGVAGVSPPPREPAPDGAAAGGGEEAAGLDPDDDDGEAAATGTADSAEAPRVPIVVEVTPAPRTVYSGGVSVSTDAGFGVTGGVQRRWVNRRGHKANVEVELSQRLTAAAANYEIFYPGAQLRSLNLGATHRRETTDSSESETSSVFAMENRLWRGWLRDLGLRALYGDFEIGGERQRSTLLFAEGRLYRRDADDALFPTRGYSVRLEARAGSEALLSDTDFAQVRAEGRLIHPLGETRRAHARVIVGATRVDDFDALPPELRFFAGGDRTIRGYGYQALGPRNDAGFVIGGKHLAVLSAELEQDISRSFALAAFVDSGNAFNEPDDFEWATGVGVGVRWRSPVGLVRLDLGHGLDDGGSSIELHLVIGPDL